jgi:ABC-2 type transport system permease protein
MNFEAIYIIWLRELKRYFRAKSNIIGSIAQNFFWLAIFGFGLGASVMIQGTGNYIIFLAPGIVGMTLLFSSIFSGIGVVWDKQFGFLKEILVAPVPRSSIMLGKTLGGATTATVQAFIMLLLAGLLGVPIFTNPIGILIALGLMLITACGFVALGVAIASTMKDPHGFQLIMNFIVMPLFLLSGAFFPVTNLPSWLHIIVLLDPLTYAVDGLRNAVIGSALAAFPFTVTVPVLVGFMVATVLLGSFLFRKTQI